MLQNDHDEYSRYATALLSHLAFADQLTLRLVSPEWRDAVDHHLMMHIRITSQPMGRFYLTSGLGHKLPITYSYGLAKFPDTLLYAVRIVDLHNNFADPATIAKTKEPQTVWAKGDYKYLAFLEGMPNIVLVRSCEWDDDGTSSTGRHAFRVPTTTAVTFEKMYRSGAFTVPFEMRARRWVLVPAPQINRAFTSLSWKQMFRPMHMEIIVLLRPTRIKERIDAIARHLAGWALHGILAEQQQQQQDLIPIKVVGSEAWKDDTEWFIGRVRFAYGNVSNVPASIKRPHVDTLARQFVFRTMREYAVEVGRKQLSWELER